MEEPGAVWTAIASALVFGLYAGLAPGPTLTLVVSQTLRFGRREGIKVACAPLVTDAPIVALSLLVLSSLEGLDRVLGTVSLVGAAFLLFVAIECFRAAPPQEIGCDVAPRSLVKGAFANALNPHPYVAWLTVVGPQLMRAAEAGLVWAAAFLLLFYGVMIGAKIAVAALVARGRSLVAGRGYRVVMTGLGLLLLGFAARFALDGVGRLT